MFLFAIPSEGSESWLAGRELDGEGGCSERSRLTVNFGFQLEIEAISALVILPMDLDGVESVCIADSTGDEVGGAG